MQQQGPVPVQEPQPSATLTTTAPSATLGVASQIGPESDISMESTSVSGSPTAGAPGSESPGGVVPMSGTGSPQP